MAIALVHYPVLDRRGDQVTSAVTNLDIHDLARLSATYGVSRFYLVTPAEEQQQLVERILSHWCDGFGSSYNPTRAKALESVRVVDDFDAALSDWQSLAGPEALPLFTGARQDAGLEYQQGRDLACRQPLLLVFGTGHGLAPELRRPEWPVLAPIRAGHYNHLSVRAAVAIILDRLIGEQGRPEPV
jgi:hypothetical protein